MLACKVHVGSTNIDIGMRQYVYSRRQDGANILNLVKTWEKLMFAARVIVAIENPQDICAISARPLGQRAVTKFSTQIGCQSIAGRFTPGTFTNQIQAKFIEPRLLIVLDPRLDRQAIREASYVNVPVIAFCDTDSPLSNVDIAIPANNKGRMQIGLLWWLLAREVLRLRGSLSRNQQWDVMVDTYFYRDPDEATTKESKDEQLKSASRDVASGAGVSAGAATTAGASGASGTSASAVSGAAAAATGASGAGTGASGSSSASSSTSSSISGGSGGTSGGQKGWAADTQAASSTSWGAADSDWIGSGTQ